MLVFFGIRSYRENVGNGEITFRTSFLLGIGITLISCAFYVATWEIIYFKFMPNFMDDYGSHTIEKLRAAGATAAVIQAKINEFNQLKQNYKNPFYNSALTFIEPFPGRTADHVDLCSDVEEKTQGSDSRDFLALRRESDGGWNRRDVFLHFASFVSRRWFSQKTGTFRLSPISRPISVPICPGVTAQVECTSITAFHQCLAWTT